jgi:hypothetical protein
LVKFASKELKFGRFTKNEMFGEKVGVIGIPTYQGEYTCGSSKPPTPIPRFTSTYTYTPERFREDEEGVGDAASWTGSGHSGSFYYVGNCSLDFA